MWTKKFGSGVDDTLWGRGGVTLDSTSEYDIEKISKTFRWVQIAPLF